jgi:tetratricopeptide (TPR) repeat protein
MPTVDHATHPDRLHQLLHTLGRAYLQREQYAEAFDKFQQLLALNGDNSEILLDTAIAALGLNEASEQMLPLYQKAVAHNPDSVALRLGLASLFVHRNVTTPFAVEICQSAADMAPANEKQIRLYLKDYYEAAGLPEKARREEQRAILISGDGRAIRNYLEKLWWEGNFAEAYAALSSAPGVNGSYGQFAKELATTHAYELLTTGKSANGVDAIKTILAALPMLSPAESFLDLRDYLTLRLSLFAGQPDQRHQAANQVRSGKPPRHEELPQSNGEGKFSQFMVNPFDLREELLNPLAKPVAEQANANEALDATWRGFLCTQVSTLDGRSVPDRLLDLFSNHLDQIPDTALRRSGAGFVSLATDPILQIRAMVDFMQNLEDYNTAVPESDRVMLIAGLQITRQPCRNHDRETLAALVEAAHLLRVAELTAASESVACTLLLRSEDDELAKLRETGINVMPMAPVPLLPGKESSCAEVVWRNPLSQLKAGQTYTFGRFEIRQRLLKHNTYATYLALDLRLDRPLVMKIMLPAEATKFHQNQEKLSRLHARIRSIARLSHPHLAFIHDMGEHEGMLYFGREYIDGKNLAELNFREEQRDGEILVMLQKIVRALLYASNKGIIHLNLKPGNIWLSDAQELKITDFRIAGFAEDGTASNVLFPAHWRYLAPEILFGEEGDTRSDIYSIGIIAYELIAVRHPYNTAGAINSPKDVFKARIAPLSEQERPHHRAWDDFVMRAIQRDPDKRFFDLAEMDQELRNIQMEMLKKALNSGR